jgi:nitrite reductase/ring-hydroxylating ferredoxin subunit
MYMLLGAATIGYTGNKFFSNKISSADPSIVDHHIDFADALLEGEMKELKVGSGDDDKVLIARYQGKLYSVGNYCSHFGAPLSTGQLFDDKVLCPWHAAAFSIITGAVELAPGMDGLPKFKIVEKDGKSFVQVPSTLPRKQAANMAKRDPANHTRYVIIGGGPAGLNCAETLRQSNFTGEILVISDDKLMPYDRTLLTKVIATGDASKFKLREDAFLAAHDINYKLNTRAESVDTSSKTVKLSDGSTIVRFRPISLILNLGL